MWSTGGGSRAGLSFGTAFWINKVSSQRATWFFSAARLFLLRYAVAAEPQDDDDNDDDEYDGALHLLIRKILRDSVSTMQPGGNSRASQAVHPLPRQKLPHEEDCPHH